MHKFHFNIAINKKLQNAGTKANVDCKAILQKNGYVDLEIYFVKSIYLFPLNLLRLLYKLISYLRRIPPESLVVTQYPLLGINRYFHQYAALLKKKKCTLACIIHDIDGLRNNDEAAIQREIKILSAYDVVIAHNTNMRLWLLQHGYRGRIVEIGLFDYLTDFAPKPLSLPQSVPYITFAGNLEKCGFLKDIAEVNSINLNLYGPGLDNAFLKNINSSIQWLGSFPINEIVFKLNGSYGLIWDGNSISDITGNIGDYLKYNTPHKLSLYLAAGIPVIIPEKAAMAAFVKEKNIGLTISSLTGLADAIGLIGSNEYKTMQTNAAKLGQGLRQGASFTKALNMVENIWKGNE